MPVLVGQGAYMDDYLKWLSTNISGGFENGIIDPNSHTGGFDSTDAELQALRVPYCYWGKKFIYNRSKL